MDTAPQCRIDYCSFCGASQGEVHIIAGPGKAGTPERKLICYQCVGRAVVHLAAPPIDAGAGSIQAMVGQMVEIADADRICSFCHKRRATVERLLGGPGDAAICNECIRLCDEIITEQSGQG